MESALNDKRFANVAKDPKYRRVPTSTRKVAIDKRFNAMFNDKRFNLKYTVDKRGKPINLTCGQQLKDYYEIESEEEDGDNEDDGDEKEEEPRPSTSKSEEPSAKKEKVKGFLVSPIKEGKKKLKAAEEEITPDVRTKLQDLTVDYARGEGYLFSDSSSDEEESTEEDEDDVVYHDWGELDKDAGETDEATKRLAVCNMDWDRIRAVDLMVLLNSFAPQGGAVQNVTIYPSEFGLQRMKDEETLGPKELVETKCLDEDDKDGEENDEESDYHREKLRQYQLNRLKYYYAVVECDTDATARKIYEECDGHEFESSAARLDLRFIPDDMTFDDQDPHDICNVLPDMAQYEPRIFMNSALQQAEVHLTWDETDPSRMQTMQKLFQTKGKQKGGQIDEAAIKDFLATSSEEEDDDEQEAAADETADGTESCMGENDRIAKYRNLLASLSQKEEESRKGRRGDGDMEMEISWGVGLKEKAQKLVNEKLAEKNVETAWEQQLAKNRQKRAAKRKEKKQMEVAPASSDEEDDDVPSDVDMNDPYFKEEFDKEEFKPKTKKKEKKPTAKEEEVDKAGELELLLMDENDGKRHFSLKSIMKEEGLQGKKGTKKKPEGATNSKEKDFKIQVEDPRFSALFTSHHFNLDPSDPNFRATESIQAILNEKQKRRAADTEPSSSEQPEAKKATTSGPKDPELSRLVRSVKMKTAMQQNQQKFKKARN